MRLNYPKASQSDHRRRHRRTVVARASATPRTAQCSGRAAAGWGPDFTVTRIIHGGTKYALSGKLTGASEAIKHMPARWLDSLAGSGELDLSGVRIACDHQLMIHNDSMAGRVTQFLASKALRGRVEADHTPEFLPANTKVYRLSEPVIDTRSLVQKLSEVGNLIEDTATKIDAQNGVVTLASGEQFQADRIVLTAGEGIEGILNASAISKPTMQRRPLQMLVGHGELPPLWAHIVGTGTKPLATITTHNGVWYVGGGIAEDGAAQTEAEFLNTAPVRLQALLPSIDMSAVEWQSIPINRAEPATDTASRPDHPFVSLSDCLCVAWPTKLALAPALSDEVLPWLKSGHGEEISDKAPPLATTPWHPYA